MEKEKWETPHIEEISIKSAQEGGSTNADGSFAPSLS